MKNAQILDKYRKIQEKYELPHFQELKDAFRFDSENFENIDKLRVEISDQLFSFSERVIEHVLTGNEAFCCLFEQDMVTDEERQRIFDLYKKIQVLKWENNLLLIKPNERRTIDWIQKTWSLWNNDLEGEMTKICKKMSENWSDLRFKNEKTTYHG
jgi:hypothetical protein